MGRLGNRINVACNECLQTCQCCDVRNHTNQSGCSVCTVITSINVMIHIDLVRCCIEEHNHMIQTTSRHTVCNCVFSGINRYVTCTCNNKDFF